ncbi:MAG: glycoside hydrolase family 16 protein [Candidatus Obscuribacterales bacterium]|nr:glycoside hydrolase family 16 protein [Candidatus Obscuribacterales bacterium]
MLRHWIGFFLIFATTILVPPAHAIKLAKPVSWGSPDQSYGKRRSVTNADREEIRRYRSGTLAPVFQTDFTDPKELESDWRLMTDHSGKICRTPDNVQVSKSGLTLKTMIATNCPRNHWSTGSIQSKSSYQFGFFEAKMKIADIKGMNNAFWMNTANQPATRDYFEIDVCECQYPSYDHIGLQQYPAKKDNVALSDVKHSGMGWGASVTDDLSAAFHDYGVLWKENEMIFAIDGEPIAAVVTNGAVIAPADVMFSSALIYDGVPDNAEGHDMHVKSVRIYKLVGEH